MIVPICVGDNGEISINLYNLKGLLDLSSIKWLPLKLIATPKYTIDNYNIDPLRLEEVDTSKKVFADLSRICELEDSEIWRNLIAEGKPKTIPYIKTIEKFFYIQDIEYSDVDILAYKLKLTAAKEGIIPYQVFGIDARIVNTRKETANEVKRDGFIIERHSEIQLRIGDCFVFYYSRNP